VNDLLVLGFLFSFFNGVGLGYDLASLRTSVNILCIIDRECWLDIWKSERMG
jgi:hypothetical protein